MSEKVTITREQAEAIETELKDEGKVDIVEYHIKHNYTSDVPIAKENMSTDKLIQALYIGYEVEPEFKKGQWVVLDDYAHRPIIAKILEIDIDGDGRTRLDWSDHCWWGKERIRHATESEIAAEKERRFWKKLDRKTREYRVGDLAKKYGSAEVREINYIEEDKSVGFAGLLHLYKPEEIKIVCPVENRLDLKENA